MKSSDQRGSGAIPAPDLVLMTFHLPAKVNPARWPADWFAACRVFCCLWLTQIVGVAQLAISLPLSSASPLYREDRILIQPKPEISLTALNNFHAARNVELLRTFEGIGRLQVLGVPEGETVPGL